MPLHCSQYLLGVARVHVTNLCFAEDESWLDECGGCCMSNLDYHLPALISPNDLSRFISASGFSEKDLHRTTNYLELDLPAPFQLPCLHGKSRLLHASSEATAPKWLPVDLYAAGNQLLFGYYLLRLIPADITVDHCRSIRQTYKRHEAPCDGEVFLAIRSHCQAMQSSEAEKWTERLSPSKRKTVKQIQGPRNTWLVEALDRLAPFRGIWKSFQLGSLPAMLSWQCREELASYLSEMATLWHKLTQGAEHYCDESTVSQLQGLVPRWSLADRQRILMLFNAEAVFARMDIGMRQDALRVILGYKGQILSFSTFYKDAKVLKCTMLSLRVLFPFGRMRPTARTALQGCFSNSLVKRKSSLIQYKEDDNRWVDVPAATSIKWAYWQICLAALRQHDTSSLAQTKELLNVAGSHTNTVIKPGWIARLATTASQLGLHSLSIRQLSNLSPRLCDIEKGILLERSPLQAVVSQGDFEAEALERLGRRAVFHNNGSDTQPQMACSELRENNNTHESMYIGLVLEALSQKPEQHVTSFGRLVLSFSAFFGDLSQDLELIGAVNAHWDPIRNQDPEILFSVDSHAGDIDTSLPSPSTYSAGTEEIHGLEPGSVETPPPPPTKSFRSAHSIVFWFLRKGKRAEKVLTCQNSPVHIKETLDKIRSQGSCTFLLLSQERLTKCTEEQLRRLSLHRPYLDIYYCDPRSEVNFIGSRLKQPRSASRDSEDRRSRSPLLHQKGTHDYRGRRSRSRSPRSPNNHVDREAHGYRRRDPTRDHFEADDAQG
jgi:hypothetical protein